MTDQKDLMQSLKREAGTASHTGMLAAEPRIKAFGLGEEITWVQREIWALAESRMDEIMASFTDVLLQDDNVRAVFEAMQSSGQEVDGSAHFREKLNSPIDQVWVDAAAGFGSFALGVGLPTYLAVATVQAGYVKCGEFAAETFADDAARLARIMTGIQKLCTLETEIVVSSIEFYSAQKEQARVAELAASFQTEVLDVVSITSEQAEELKQRNDRLRDELRNVQSYSADVATAAAQSAAAMEEATQTVVRIGQNIDAAKGAASGAASLSQEVSGSVEAAKSSVAELSVRNKDIDSVATLINNITEQTNILALNATIEAARMGDAGAAFSVVATEVKELATQTGSATRNIEQQVQAIHSASVIVEEATEQLRAAISDLNKASLNVKSEIETQADSMLKIGSAVDETTIGAQQVSERISKVNATTEQLVHEADEIEKSYAGVTAQLSTLKEKSSNFLNQINS